MTKTFFRMDFITAWEETRDDPNGKPTDGWVVAIGDKTDWMSTADFNELYHDANEMSFGQAIESLEAGFMLQRQGWNGKGQFLELQTPDEHSKMSLPYIFINTVTGDRVPWLASQSDMLAKDWQVVPHL